MAMSRRSDVIGYFVNKVFNLICIWLTISQECTTLFMAILFSYYEIDWDTLSI